MTRKMMLIACVAGLALAVPASAQKGDRRSGDQAQQAESRKDDRAKAQRPQRSEQRAQSQRADRPQRAERMQRVERERPQRAERQQRQVERRAQRVERAERPRIDRPQRAERQLRRVERQTQRVERAERPRIDRQQRAERQLRRVERQTQRVERSERPRIDRPQRAIERQAQRADRQDGLRELRQRVVSNDRAGRQLQRSERREQRLANAQFREGDRVVRRADRVEQRPDRRFAERFLGTRDGDRGTLRAARFDGRGYRPVAPLFSDRDMRPMRPFKAKYRNRIVSIGNRVNNDWNLRSVPVFYSGRYVDTPDYYYRYDNDLGYVYRIERRDNIVRSLIPLFGGYGIGDPWPSTYYSSYVPLGYRDYYYDTPDYYYRYDGQGIYQIDGQTQLITALVALLTGQGYGIGQMLPASYGVYNVPLEYRRSYFDTDDRMYRYGDGYIYQVDPGSRRIAARYPVYADDYFVGEPWPVAYPDYNVPIGYQSLYYDTPQYQYRYANGGIYQVDPTNQLILAVVALVSGQRFGIGQPLPAGYDSYNVPLAYRDDYYDTDDDWYRYADGYVYRVDPDNGLIEEAFPVYA